MKIFLQIWRNETSQYTQYTQSGNTHNLLLTKFATESTYSFWIDQTDMSSLHKFTYQKSMLSLELSKDIGLLVKQSVQVQARVYAEI
jgi:hypothetical protein